MTLLTREALLTIRGLYGRFGAQSPIPFKVRSSPISMVAGTPTTRLATPVQATTIPLARTGEPRNHNFDYLRLFLAVEVVAMHLNAGLLRGNLWVPIPPVAAFVALSGFLIPQSLERSRSLGHFAWKRALRTLPALIPLMLAIGLAYDVKHVERAIIQYLSAGYHSMFQGCVLPLWSLIVEDGLYAAIALLFVFGSHRTAWLTTAIIGVLLVAQARIDDHVFDYRFLQTSIGFFVGNLAFIWKDRLSKVHWAWPAVTLSAAVAGWLAFLGPLVFPLIIGCVVVLAMTSPQIRWGIPDLSYAIYIWHAPIMLALLGPWAMPRDARWVTATVVLTLVASTLSWYVVEKPALQLKNWRPGSQRDANERRSIETPATTKTAA